jgi:hypothetical protein
MHIGDEQGSETADGWVLLFLSHAASQIYQASFTPVKNRLLFQENDSLWISRFPMETAVPENRQKTDSSKLYGAFVSCKKSRDKKLGMDK